jgi:hypothetical protein
MPLGIEIMHWDERVGAEIIASHPEELMIQEKTLMQLYSQHEFTGEKGMVSLMTGSTHLTSYYTGPETAVYVVLVLNMDEDGDAYEEGLSEISRQIMMDLDPDVLGAILPSLFQRLSVYPTLNNEQRLALLYNNEVKRMILQRLKEEVAVIKSEITIWLKDTHRESFVDVESILSSMIKTTLIKVSSVEGMASDVIFLAKDIMMLRRPPMNLFRDPVDHHMPESLKDAYRTDIISFFKNYTPNQQDNLEIIEKVILNPPVYEVLKLMREAVVTLNDVEKLRKKGVDDVEGALQDLWKTKMIGVFKDDSGQEYYGLITDFYVDFYFPRFLLNNIRHQYKLNIHNPNTLLKALNLMKEEYFSMDRAKKAALKASALETS